MTKSGVEVGIQVAPRERAGEKINLADYIELVKNAEAGSFDSLWSSDILDRPIPRFDSLTYLAGLAMMTKRVRLGTMVLAGPFRHPIHLARTAVTIDHLSGGRLTLGIGIGGRYAGLECKSFGFTSGQRAARTAEVLEALKRLWTEDRVTFQGKHFSFEDSTLHPKPVQKPHPPLWIGGDSEPAFERVVRFGNGWLAGSHLSSEEFRERRQRIIELAEEKGRDPKTIHWGCELNFNIREDSKRAAEESREWYNKMGGFITGGRSFDRIFLPIGAYGPVNMCIDKIGGFVTEGARTIILKPRTTDVLQQFELLEEKVIPHIMRL